MSIPKNRSAQIEAARKADEQIASAWAAYWDAQAPIDAKRDELREVQKRLDKYRKAGTFRANIEDGLLKHIADIESRIEALKPAADAAQVAAIALDDELYEGWNRFFLVQHIHRSMHCSSFRPGTKIGWLPKVSGLTEAEAIAEYGAILCTICFPSAPVEYTNGVPNDGRCPGSGKHIDRSLPHRLGFYGGNSVTCQDCGKVVGISRNSFKVPKHQAATA